MVTPRYLMHSCLGMVVPLISVVDLFCPRPGCSPTKGHDLDLANAC